MRGSSVGMTTLPSATLQITNHSSSNCHFMASRIFVFRPIRLLAASGNIRHFSALAIYLVLSAGSSNAQVVVTNDHAEQPKIEWQEVFRDDFEGRSSLGEEFVRQEQNQ